MIDWIRVIKNIPRRFRQEVSEQIVAKKGFDPRAAAFQWYYLNENVGFACPNHALVIAIWHFHAGTIGGRRELESFLDLAKGCSRLMDVGASAGMFSALFSNTRSQGAILAVEPDQISFDLLHETAHCNEKKGMDWYFAQSAISDFTGTINFEMGGFGGLVGERGVAIPCHTLESISEEYKFTPDIIKIDIESFEFEALRGAKDWLRKHKPRIFLELHLGILEERGISYHEVVHLLQEIGYKTHQYSSYERAISRTEDRARCARISLVCNHE